MVEGIEFEMLERMDFATALKTARHMAGLEQDELAVRTGVAVQIVIRWESSGDNHWPSAVMMPRLKAALGSAAKYLEQWDLAHQASFRQILAPQETVTTAAMLRGVIQLGAEFGDVARVAELRLGDGDCSVSDAKVLAKELREVMGKAHQLLVSLPGMFRAA